ncbi:MAG TPA: hypothetical protein VGM54_22035 [Chthoniobacter sp.]|jgi:hypothetical protein
MRTVAASILPGLLEHLFFRHYRAGLKSFSFWRAEIDDLTASIGIRLPRDLRSFFAHDCQYSAITSRITQTAPPHLRWMVSSTARGRCRFSLAPRPPIIPTQHREQIDILDATPAVIEKYRIDDEQALLAKMRYNRLIDLFTGLTCYTLQSHRRTGVKGIGQVETDEIYIGIDRQGVHYVVPVQAKGGKERLGIIQISHDFALAAEHFSELVCRPVAAQFLPDGAIALLEFTQSDKGIVIRQEAHYRLVPPEELTAEDLERYRAVR